MKKVFLYLSLALLTSVSTLAQGITLKTQTGIAFLGGGDLLGKMLQVEAQIPVWKRFLVAPVLGFANARAFQYQYEDRKFYNYAQAINLDLNVLFKPLASQSGHELNVGGGVSFRNFSNMYYNSFLYSPSNIGNLVSYTTTERQGFDIGWTATVDYIKFFNQKWGVGVKTSLQNYHKSSTVLFGGVAFGIKL